MTPLKKAKKAPVKQKRNVQDLSHISFRCKAGNEWMFPELMSLASKENRSLNNYIENILLSHLAKKGISAPG